MEICKSNITMWSMLVLLLSVLIFCFVTPFVVFACTQVSLDGNAKISYVNTGSGEEEYVPPTLDNTGEQKEELANGGLTVNGDGELQLGNNLGNADPETAQSYRENLKASGILSFIRLSGSMCKAANDLTVILDFSKYYITGFGGGCFEGLMYALFGSADVVFTEEVLIYNAVTGSIEGTEMFTFDGSLSQGTVVALRIVLPNLGDNKTITFDKLSLAFKSTASGVDTRPSAVEIDVSYCSPSTKVDISAQAVGQPSGKDGYCDHIHFIGTSDIQVQECLQEAETLFGLVKIKTFVTEVFVKPSAGTSFARLNYSLTKSDASTWAVYDTRSYTGVVDESTLPILKLASYIRNISSSRAIKHYKYSIDGGQQNNSAIVTVTNVSESRYSVSCAHTGGIIGYFDNGNFYNANNELL